MARSFGMLGLVVLALPPAVSADGTTFGRIIVPGDHFQPGEEISIQGSQISGRLVRLQLVQGSLTVDLGEANVALDGTFESKAAVPATFPLGYAELTATDENGNESSTIILIGDRAEGAQPGVAAPIDDRVIGLTLAGIGTLLFLIASAWYVRSRPKDSAKRN